MDKKEFLKYYVVDRHGTDSMKWDTLNSKFGCKDLISMWIADMEFRTCDEIINAMVARVRQGVFGYSCVPDQYYAAYSGWMEERYGFPICREWVRFSTGCVTGIAWMLNAFTRPGDACLILTPVYYPFHDVVLKNNRKLVTVDLAYDNGRFTLDFDAIERAIIKNKVRVFVQCSPHNPAGRVWTEDELDKLFHICEEHQVLIVSDEIHQDLVVGDKKFIPAAVVRNGAYRDRLITLSSASKTFNLASLLHSHIVITDEKLMETYDRFAHALNRTEMNVMGLTATMAGYTYGAEWLSMVLAVIRGNYTYLQRELALAAPKIIVCPLEGTYLAFLDLRRVMPANEAAEFALHKCHLAVDYGEQFGENFRGFIRLNLATDPKLVQQAVYNIIAALKETI